MKDLNTTDVRNDLFYILGEASAIYAILPKENPFRDGIYRIYEGLATILLDDKSEGVKKKPYEN